LLLVARRLQIPEYSKQTIVGRRGERKMKNLKLKLITAAAMMIVATATASAQSNLTANVPFSFKVNSQTVLPAGDYNVIRGSTNPVIWAFEDRVTGQKTMVAMGQLSWSRRSDPAKLEFRCHAAQCALSKIQVGNSEAGYEINASKTANAEVARTVVVPLTRGYAE